MEQTISNGTAKIAAQVILESAKEMFGPQPCGGYSQPEIRHVNDVTALLNSLEDLYGPTGAHGLAQRFGKTIFRHGLRQLGGKAGFRALEYRILPSPKRVEVGLAALAEMVAESTGEKITLSEDSTHWIWRADRSQDCLSSRIGEPCCFALVGMIQEFAAWASGGRFYRVVETECRAAGADSCCFMIEKKPLD